MKYMEIEKVEVPNEAGELVPVDLQVRTQTLHTVASEEGDYIKLYIATLGKFAGLHDGESSLLIALAKRMTFAGQLSFAGVDDGQVVYVNKALKEDIARETGMKVTTISQYLTRLCKSGMLKRLALGKYQVNPSVIGRGYAKDIVRLRATFDFVTGDVRTEFAEKDSE